MSPLDPEGAELHVAREGKPGCVARLIIRQIERSCIVRPDPCDGQAGTKCEDKPPSDKDLCRCAQEFCHCCHRREHEHVAAGAQADLAEAGPEGERERGAEREPEGGTEPSSADVREQARGPQEGAGLAGSTEEQREQAHGPQEGADTAGSTERAKEQAKGSQEGVK
jgi:hypothetical protein